MKAWIMAAAVILFTCQAVPAANIVRKMSQSGNMATPRLACQNPEYGFTPREVEVCVTIFPSCVRPEFKQYQRDLCIVEAVKKGRQPPARARQTIASPAAGEGGRQKKTLTFVLDAFQAYDLIELCERPANKRRPLCAGYVIPNKAKIVSDISAARR